MSLMMLLMAGGGPSVYLEDASGSYIRTTVGSAGVRLDSDGNLYTTETSGSYVSRFAWLLSGNASDYECLATLNPGGDALNGGTTGSWLDCGVDQTWTLGSGTSGVTNSASFTLAIRRKSTATNLASATMSLTAELIV